MVAVRDYARQQPGTSAIFGVLLRTQKSKAGGTVSMTNTAKAAPPILPQSVAVKLLIDPSPTIHGSANHQLHQHANVKLEVATEPVHGII